MPTRYNLRFISVATGAHVADAERAMRTGTATATSVSPSCAASVAEMAVVWSTDAGAPGVATFPAGTYTAVLNVTAAGANLSYGLRSITQGATTFIGHFARVDSGLTADQESIQQTEAVFTGTGLKTATASWTPTAGSTADRFEIAVAMGNSATMAQSFTITTDDGTSYAEIPDAAGGAKAPPPFQQRLRVIQRVRTY